MRLDPWLLRNAEFSHSLHLMIDNYFQNNLELVALQASLWEAMKATVRGDIISYATNQKRTRIAHIADLEARSLQLESQHLQTGDRRVLHDLLNTQTLIKQVQSEEAKVAWRAMQSCVYQWGDKASTMLHRHILRL